MVIHKKVKTTGKERGLPKAFANRPKLISRVGIFTGFTATNAFKVCWGGTDNADATTTLDSAYVRAVDPYVLTLASGAGAAWAGSVSTGGNGTINKVPFFYTARNGDLLTVPNLGADYASGVTVKNTPSFKANDWSGAYGGRDFEGRNLLIHWIRCINNNSKDKEVHFWQNNYDATAETTVGSTGGSDRQIGDVTHADYMFNIAMAAGEGQHDIRLDFPLPLLIMGGCTIAVRDVSEHDNTDRGMFLAADTDCVVQICYTVLNSTPANAPYKRLKYKYLSAFSFSGGGTSYSGSGINEFSGDQSVIRPDSASTKWFEDIELWGHTIMNRINPLGDADGKIAQARCKNAASEIVCSAAVVKGPANALPLPIVIHDEEEPGGGSTPFYAPNIFGWCHGLRVGTAPLWAAWFAAMILLNFTWPPIEMLTHNFKMFDAGSDTQVSMFRFPVYVRGRSGVVDNFRVSVSGTAAEETKSTWFYRPARKKGLLHRWI
jgi:hypothetical protein